MEEKKNDLLCAKDLGEMYKKELTKFETDYGNVLIEDDFLKYAKKCVGPAFENIGFVLDDVQLVCMCKAFQACNICDVL